ncbi:MAG: heparinase, partial [Alphaproteobacteria bacterium]|nr:heparinase [Alphaproteobacteria bacterium]
MNAAAPVTGRLRDELSALLFRTPLYHASLAGRAELKFAPEDALPGEPAAADALFRGDFCFAGEEHRLVGGSPWRYAEASSAWQVELHGFGWLRDFAANGGAAARRKARELCAGWLAEHARWDALPWRPDLIGRRLATWVCHAPFLLENADAAFRAAFLDSIARQARHLRRTALRSQPGLPRLEAVGGLALAGLTLADGGAWLARAERLIGAEIGRQILADGGHASRSPGALFAALALLTTLARA